ncbi:LA2681 family HEPN domain-containing protein [Streptomyces sp. NBC_00370]|uniref:LA2681 family HEPN domain-containing protein n=1 Tax=Streptomyces sp. NBC_00370 TaxID=2975728 RepID=UPI002E274CB3
MDEVEVSAVFDALSEKIIRLNDCTEADREEAMRSLIRLDRAVDESTQDGIPRALLRLMLSSVMINIAADAHDVEGLKTGVKWAAQLIDDEALPWKLRQQGRYNYANGILERYQIEEATDTCGHFSQVSDPEFRLKNTEDLRVARTLLSSVGNDAAVPPPARSRALCNLGNVLDESGRWVESYAAYTDSLLADPSNGNAAGNIAELLRRRLMIGTGQQGHLAAVYNRYVLLAQVLDEQTVEIAGVGAAERWRSLELADTEGHLSHTGNTLDPYQQWIVKHRLALVEVVEGLGSDGERWDSASVSAVAADSTDASVPNIFAAFNVLKAEFLVARRLAFRGVTMINESELLQHPDDSGVYTDTLDGGFYGEGTAMLLLAQRSALDVLDKIAVTANEHFKSGMNPAKVGFTKYWMDSKSSDIRPSLTAGDAGRRPILALAELAIDIENGMYSDAKLLRNAGTHRLVHATFGRPTGPTKETFSSVDITELEKATISALWVVRAAYLYLVDLLDSQAPEGGDGLISIPNQR